MPYILLLVIVIFLSPLAFGLIKEVPGGALSSALLSPLYDLGVLNITTSAKLIRVSHFFEGEALESGRGVLSNIADFAFNPKVASHMYIAAEQGQLFYYPAGIAPIELAGSAFLVSRDLLIKKISIDPVDSSNLYIIAEDKESEFVFYSSDGGVNFSERYSIPKEHGIRTLAHHPLKSGDIFVFVGKRRLIRSENYGQSWAGAFDFSEDIRHFEISKGPKPALFFVTVDGRILLSVLDEGRPLKFSSVSVTKQNQETVLGLAVFSKGPQQFYVFTDYGLYFTMNKGADFKKISLPAGVENLSISSVAVAGEEGELIYLAAGSIFMKTEDGGKSWSVRNIPEALEISDIKIDPADNKTVYLRVTSNQ